MALPKLHIPQPAAPAVRVVRPRGRGATDGRTGPSPRKGVRRGGPARSGHSSRPWGAPLSGLPTAGHGPGGDWAHLSLPGAPPELIGAGMLAGIAGESPHRSHPMLAAYAGLPLHSATVSRSRPTMGSASAWGHGPQGRPVDCAPVR